MSRALPLVAAFCALTLAGCPSGQRPFIKTGFRIPGTVAVVNSTADPLARKFRVEVQADNPDLVLRPGTFGSVLFEVQSRDNVLVVPQKAVLDNTHVFIVENGRAARRDVTLGLRNTLVIEVIAGLKEGDEVIVEGNYGLIAGTPVEVKR